MLISKFGVLGFYFETHISYLKIEHQNNANVNNLKENIEENHQIYSAN